MTKKRSEMTPKQLAHARKLERERRKRNHKKSLPKKQESHLEKFLERAMKSKSKRFTEAPQETKEAYLKALREGLQGLTSKEMVNKKHIIYNHFFGTKTLKTPEEKERNRILMAQKIEERYRANHPEKAEYFKALDQFLAEHGNPMCEKREKLRLAFYNKYYAEKRREQQKEYQKEYQRKYKEKYKEAHKEPTIDGYYVLGTIYKYPINIPTGEYTEERDNYVAERKQAVLQMFKTYKGDYDRMLQEVDGLIDNAKIDERLNDKFRYHELVFLNQLCRYLYQFTPESIQQEQERARQAEYYHEKAKEFLTQK